MWDVGGNEWRMLGVMRVEIVEGVVGMNEGNSGMLVGSVWSDGLADGLVR
jgi:hypothetical protein